MTNNRFYRNVLKEHVENDEINIGVATGLAAACYVEGIPNIDADVFCDHIKDDIYEAFDKIRSHVQTLYDRSYARNINELEDILGYGLTQIYIGATAFVGSSFEEHICHDFVISTIDSFYKRPGSGLLPTHVRNTTDFEIVLGTLEHVYDKMVEKTGGLASPVTSNYNSSSSNGGSNNHECASNEREHIHLLTTNSLRRWRDEHEDVSSVDYIKACSMLTMYMRRWTYEQDQKNSGYNWIRVPRNALYDMYGANYKEYRDVLEDTGHLSTDRSKRSGTLPSYKTGSYCGQYQVHMKGTYHVETFVRKTPFEDKSDKGINIFHSAFDKQQDLVEYWKGQSGNKQSSEQGEKLIEHAKSFSYPSTVSTMHMDASSKRSAFFGVLSVLNAHNRQFFYSDNRGQKDGRLHHTFTNMPKELRKEILKYNGMGNEVDVANCLPSILGGLFNGHSTGDDDKKQAFVDDIESGLLYEKLAEHIGYSRDESKTDFQRVINKTQKQLEAQNTEYVSAIIDLYGPDVWKWLGAVKRVANGMYDDRTSKSLGLILMNFERKFIVDSVHESGVDYVSVHDAIYVAKEDIQSVVNHIQDTFLTENNGVVPTIHTPNGDISYDHTIHSRSHSSSNTCSRRTSNETSNVQHGHGSTAVKTGEGEFKSKDAHAHALSYD